MIERTLVKELGNKAGVTSGYALPSLTRPQRKTPRRLFTKNLGLCKPIVGSIGADACPVLEGHVDG